MKLECSLPRKIESIMRRMTAEQLSHDSGVGYIDVVRNQTTFLAWGEGVWATVENISGFFGGVGSSIFCM
jgi:hypothetical protein